jgi:putative membrane protein
MRVMTAHLDAIEHGARGKWTRLLRWFRSRSFGSSCARPKGKNWRAREMKRLTPILWVIVAAYAVMTFVVTVFPGRIPELILILGLTLLPVAFAVLHGALRYGWAGILVFLVICLGVSNVLENLSILTGFPFGHYYYTGNLGPKLFLVPILIGPAYFGTGYLAWVLGTVLIGDVRSRGSSLTTLAVPFIASFVMVAWDLSMDPTNSTIRHNWIWQQGGGYFGVPLTNYLGWSLTVYVFLQLFALYLHFRRPSSEVERRGLSTSYFAQATVLYAVIGLGVVLAYLVGVPNTSVADAAGVVWQRTSIAEGTATVAIYTMLFATALSAVKLVQGSVAVASAPRVAAPVLNSPTVWRPTQPAVRDELIS